MDIARLIKSSKWEIYHFIGFFLNFLEKKLKGGTKHIWSKLQVLINDKGSVLKIMYDYQLAAKFEVVFSNIIMSSFQRRMFQK